METILPQSHLGSSQPQRGQTRAEEARCGLPPILSCPATHHALLQGLLNVPGVCYWEPDLSDNALLGDVNVTHVQDMVDGLHLLYLDDPGVPVGGCFL